MRPLIALLCLCLGTATHIQAQGKLGVFVGAGTMFYSGDLVETFIVPAPTFRWTVNAGLHWQINHRWGLQLNYTVGELMGDDAFALDEGRRARALSFQSYAHGVSLRGTYDILRNDRWRLLPYITAGVGGLYNDITPGPNNAVTVVQEPDYSPFTLVIPSGVGVRYQINCQWALKAEALYHWTLSDHLDDVAVRGNPNNRDGFWDIHVGAVWFFTGCGKGRKGGLIEDCDRLYKDVDIDKLMRQYGN
jgi:opacity protein-like surface antigen